MTPRKRPARDLPPNLVWRGRALYLRMSHSALGDIYKSLLTGDVELASSRRDAIVRLLQRGDFGVVRRWLNGDVHIASIDAAVRDGEYRKLKRLNIEGVTVGAAVRAYMDEAERQDATPKTLETYRVATNALVEYFGADRPLADITTDMARGLLGAQGWAGRTQANARTIYGSVWKLAIETEAEAAEQTGAAPTVTRSPWKNVQPAKVRPRQPPVIPPTEWRAIITHREIAGTPEAAWLAVGYLAGLRNAEARHLRTNPPDVDLDAGLLRIRSHDGEHAWNPKGLSKSTHSVRDVPVIPALRVVLEEHYARGYAGARYFFRTSKRHDSPLPHTTSNYWTERAFTRAGLVYGRADKDGLTHHALRHSFISNLLLKGVPVHVVAELAGNSAEIVLSTYAHLLKASASEAMAKLQEVVG
jgi:integrase